ncbi:MAG: DUF2177 family protein [Phenylobacterium sp.]|uniref:DUF2177 family protein n=1 Tax=Phenylobacterium sp. TaxID=1871053 RepID=UPI0011FC1345|nr:DUF2177 family protein [Phenylobacterium sp.]TAJ68573.1 MAG: DUF2177 family protein [Phenylobacterium sp.]
MIRLTATYFATAGAIAALDYVWLSQFGPKVYRPTLDAVLRPDSDPVSFPAAIVFYFVYILGVLALAIWPTRDKPLIKTTAAGAMLGALCYATYDLTNQATLKVWATQITLIDITWGTFLTAVGATVGGIVIRRMRA